MKKLESKREKFKRSIYYCGSEPESVEQYKKRWTSIRIVYITMFFGSLSFSLVLASLWPYLQKVNKSDELDPTYVGWAAVSFHISGIIVDFVMGLWTNKRGSMEPLLLSLLVFGCGNFLYGYAEACGQYGVAVIIASRGIIGLSTGVNVIARSALSDSTTIKERTTALAHMSLAEGVGFAFGPAVQLLSIPLGDKGVYLPILKLHLNLYTTPAFISVFVTMLNVFLIIGYYYEYHINDYKDCQEDAEITHFKALMERHRGTGKLNFDKSAIIFILFLYFVAQSAFSLYETILPPLTMDMLAWTKRETALYASILFISAGIIAIFAFAISESLEKIFSDKGILFLGYALIFLGFAIHLPWGSGQPDIKKSYINKTNNMTYTDTTGCPQEYSWCEIIPKLYLPQIIVGTVFLSLGYPLVMVFTSSLYSKVLGPAPQGIMQSWFGCIGSTARITSPILVTFLYANFGPRWTFISVDSLVVTSMFLLLIFCKRLIPYHLFVLKKEQSKSCISDGMEVEDNMKIPENKVVIDDDLTNSNVILRPKQYRPTRPNRWSLIDRSSYYSTDSMIM